MAPTPKHSYTKNELLDALSRVRSGELSLNLASKLYKIPYTTVRDKFRGRRPINTQDRHLLQPGEEERLVTWLTESAKRGVAKTRADIKETAKEILDSRGAVTKSPDNRPSKQWLKDFFLRHPELSHRTSSALGKERALVSHTSLAFWFSEMKAYIDNEDSTLLSSPDRIYNADKTVFSLCPKTKRVIALKGSKHVYSLSSNARHNITVMACCSASGHFLPPLLIFPYKRMPSFNVLQGFEEASFQITSNGWINAHVFFTWLRDCFIPSVVEKQKPVVLYVDGHSSLTSSIEIADVCRENGIILYCLKSHASHSIQPLDEAFFGAMKSAWEVETKKYFACEDESVSVRTFSSVLKPVWEATARPETASNGFSKSGLFPYNPSRVLNSDKLLPYLTFQKSHTNEVTPSISPPTQAQTSTLTNTSTLTATTSQTSIPSSYEFDAMTSTSLPQTSTLTTVSTSTLTATTTSILSPTEDLKKLLQFTAMIGPQKLEFFWENYFADGNPSTDPQINEFKQLLEKVIKPSSVSSTNVDPPVKRSVETIVALPQFPSSKKSFKNPNQASKKSMATTGIEFRHYIVLNQKEKEGLANAMENRKLEREESRKRKLIEKEEKKKIAEEKKRKVAEEKEAIRKRKENKKMLRKILEGNERLDCDSDSDESANVVEYDNESEVMRMRWKWKTSV